MATERICEMEGEMKALKEWKLDLIYQKPMIKTVEMKKTNQQMPITLLETEGTVEETTETAVKFPIENAVCVHRVGELEIGDLAVWVGVSSGHRDEAFRACRYIIDEVKQRVPVWKKEYYASGDSGWVNCEACATPGHSHG